MAKKSTVGYEAFAKWELELARGKAKGLIGRYGLTESDFGDLEQEMLLQVHLKRGVREGWAKITASERTVMSRILDNKIRDIIDELKTEKRRLLSRAERLHHPLSPAHEGDGLTLEDTVSEEASLARTGRKSAEEEHDLQIVLASVLENLTELQKRACQLLMEGHKITDVADALGMKRTTLNYELTRMRNVFYREGLGDYF